MKRLYYLLIVLMGVCMVACGNDENVDNNREPAVDKITLSKSVIEVGFEPDTYSVNVTSPYSWDAFSASDWIEVVTYQGDAGIAELSFNITTRNAELEKRMGSIVVTNSEHNLVAELYITQKIFEPTEIAIDRESLTFTADGGEQSITVTANFAHKATTDADWLRITKFESGYTISASKYMEVEARTAEVVISNEKYNISKTISISQSAFEPILNVEDKSALEFDYKGGEQLILVESNFEYDIATDADWVTLSKTTTGVVVKVSFNRGDARTAEVVISNEKYNISKTISISQSAFEPILNVEDKSMLEFSYMGGEQSILVESNFEYDIATDADWVTLSKTTTGVVVKVSFNRGDARTANVTISSAKYNFSGKVIPITQQKWEPVSEEYAVDLGLSVKWASCNVGAERPEEYGDYFAWGEISPKESYTEDNCLTYGKSMTDISGKPQYDAATANWGGAWRMPTYSELKELGSNCTWEWTTLNGVNGRKVTGPNGNSIFLPAAGYRYGTSSYDVGSYGDYWSSAPYEGGGSRAYRLYFYIGYCVWGSGSCYYGQSVRPVLE